MKKQAMIEQSQKDYIKYVNNKQVNQTPQENLNSNQSLRKRNSKLAELNTFKIGGEVREIKRKSYQDYNDNLNLNPTKIYPVQPTSNSNSILTGNTGYSKPLSGKGVTRHQNEGNYNIISNSNRPEYHENPISYTSNEYRQAINPENYDQYGRQVNTKPVQQDNPQDIKGIENLENYSAYNDHYNYRPPSGKKENKEQNFPQGYVQEKGSSQKPNNNSYSEQENYSTGNPYDKYKIDENDYKSRQNEEREYEQYNTNPQQHKGTTNQSYGEYEPQPQPQSNSNKVDLNSIPIPDHVKNVEDYEKYLISLGINPITLEYESQPQSSNIYNDNNKELSQLENNMANMNINEKETHRNDDVRYSNNPYHNQLNQYEDQYSLYQNQNQYDQQRYNEPQNQNRNNLEKQKENQQINYTVHQQPYQSNQNKGYKNQSQIFIADASAYQKNSNETNFPKKEYEPNVKTKPIVVNPCKYFI